MVSARLRLIVLSEDTGKDGAKTIQVVLRKLLQQFAPAAPLYNERGDRHEWVDASKDSTLATGAKDWKSSTTRDVKIDIRRRALFTALTTELLSHIAHDGPGTFVFLHFDGDAPWSKHPACIDCARFERFKEEVRNHLVQRMQSVKTKRWLGMDHDDVVRRAMDRLIPVQPHWSIEAWLYGGSDAARELCETRHRAEHCGDDAFWSVSREDLEARAYPKKHCCLTDEFNLELAQRFRAASAVEESPSFGALAEKVRACGDLMSALAAMT